MRVGFDVEVHAADEDLLELSRRRSDRHRRPLRARARDRRAREVRASVSLRRGGGITGRLVANATAALLSAGVLDGAAGRIARAAESSPA